MKKLFIFSFYLLGIFSLQLQAQTTTNVQELQNLAEKFKQKWEADRIEVQNFSVTNNVPVRIENDSITMEMQYINRFGKPEYYRTENKNAAATISTNKVHNGGGAGLSLDGTGMTLYEWDGGGVLSTHQEFGSRVTMGDGTTGTHYHSTHVAGTMIAAGVDPNAKGMSPSADLIAFDWNSDNSEMATEAAGGALISNHSYGFTRGWAWNGTGWDWYGNTSISNVEDYKFGFYDSYAAAWDDIAYYAPYYLICKSAGNDRGDGPGTTPPTAEIDGGADGYDCLGSQATAKNILTVGAIEDIPGSYTNPSDVVMSSFSSWGPADDGRIKPDIVANGVGLYSTYNTSNTSYESLSGTSMATPNAAGSLMLLQEHYKDLNGSGSKMRSATLKALAIHTADEAGPNPGPDYMFGWGLLNIERAAKKITEDQTNDVISEHTLNNGGTYTTTITATSGYPIKVTIAWTDPKGTPTSAQLDPITPMLVNDLDLRITNGSNTYYPWKLNRNSPSAAATNSGQNNVDNVEMVYIENPTAGETYTITVDHDGSLSGGSQAFSMIISGYPLAPSANFFANSTSVHTNETAYLNDASTENPTSWLWTISPGNYSFVNSTSATSQNPEIEFTDIGFYTITLYVENTSGNDTEIKTGYIFVTNAPTGYCEAYSTNPYGTINRVQFGSIDNSSDYTNVGSAEPNDKYYEDFTNIITDVTLLESNNLTVSSNYSDAGLDLGVWVDWNRDGDFSDTGEDVICDVDGGGVGTFNITVPGTADLGHTIMRLRIKYIGTSCNPCGATSNGEVEDYTLNIQPLPALPPIADFVADDVTPVVSTTVDFTDQSSNIPTTWLWSFDPATVNFVGGTSSTSQNPQVVFTATGLYEVTLYAENAYGNDTEVKTNYISVIPFDYCTASGGGDEYISGVQLNTINNTGTGEDSYHDYTSLSTDLELLGSYDITVTNGNAYIDDDLGVWADWNQDGDFDDSDENIVCEIDEDGQGTFSIVVPATASLGATTLRVRIKYNGSDCGSACGNTTYGEVEDYTLNITSGTLTWDGSESDDWDDPDNWDGGVVPTSSFDVIIPDAASVPNTPVIYNGTIATCANLTLESGALMVNDGNLTLTGN